MASKDDVRVDIQEKTKDAKNDKKEEEEIETSVQNLQEAEQSTNGSRGSDSGPSCRVCMESSEETSKLISPCRCSGTQQFIHFECLKQCIEQSNEDVCKVCKTKYDGLVMTASRVPFLRFLKANPTVWETLICETTAAMLSTHIILIGLMTLSIQEYLEEILTVYFPGKGLLSYFNKVHVFLYLACICCGLFGLCGLYVRYQDYNETHKLFKVSGFQGKIAREAIEAKGSKKDIVVVMEGQNAESVLVWNNYS